LLYLNSIKITLYYVNFAGYPALPCPALLYRAGQGRAGFVFFSAEQGRAGQGRVGQGTGQGRVQKSCPVIISGIKVLLSLLSDYPKYLNIGQGMIKILAESLYYRLYPKEC